MDNQWEPLPKRFEVTSQCRSSDILEGSLSVTAPKRLMSDFHSLFPCLKLADQLLSDCAVCPLYVPDYSNFM
jgi:hypothetical protein